MRRILAASVCLAVMAAIPARAGVIATVSATYDSFLSNAVFTIANTGPAAETVTLTTSLGPIKTVGLPGLLAVGASEQYAFNQINGGFGTDPFNLGTPDTTTFALSVATAGAPAASSAAFSPLANLTGATVDFLGTSCQGFAPGCGVALSGLVAQVTTAAAAVPAPGGWALFAAASVLRARRRR